jgi:serine/threonine protein phosphatase PrpC
MLRTHVELAWKTQAGHRHHVEGLGNEDAVYVTEDHPVFDAVMVVADGMGGHPRPQEASQAAVRAARQVLSDAHWCRAPGDAPSALMTAVLAAHHAVSSLRDSPYGKAPGTTLSLTVIAEGILHVAHVGDGSVFLMRDGQVQVVAGGEERRAGNRPAEYLGQDSPPEPERQQVQLAGGDRVLVCTDGLTRYFRDAGPEALERVLGRRGVDVQSIASQLTAHSRPGDYDDDTTVAVAEVAAIAPGSRASRRDSRSDDAPWEAPTAGAKESAPSRGGRTGDLILVGIIAALGGTALFALGFVLGRMPGPPPKDPSPPPFPASATAQQLKNLPKGNVVFLDRLGHRVYSLGTVPRPGGDETVKLKALRVDQSGQQLQSLPGDYVLDMGHGQLKGPNGQSWPVEVDEATGGIRVVQGGTLTVKSPIPGARIFLDGTLVGPAPQTLKLPAGHHKVRLEANGWFCENRVEVPAGRSVSLTLEPR